jgi:hypothetical protein
MTDPALEVLWKHVLNHWDDDRAHAAFLENCQRSEQLAEAAMRYRGMVGDRERGSLAEKKLGAVLALAMANLEVNRSAPATSPSRLGSLLLIVFFLLATLGLLGVYLDLP